MGSLNRDERKTLRSIQGHINQVRHDAGVLVEQIGTVDVYFHPTNPDPLFNCATPHKGVAWVRHDDLRAAFAGLERLGRVPRLVFQDALFPDAFRQQLLILGLTLENERIVMIYRPVMGPIPPDETPLGRLPDEPPAPVTCTTVADRGDLAIWLRAFRAGYFNTDILSVKPKDLDPYWHDLETEKRLFVLGYYDRMPLGAARCLVQPPLLEIETVVAVPHWHGMGLEVGLVTTAIRDAERRGCDTIFTIAPPADYRALYHRLGFIELTRVLTFWQAESYEKPDITLAIPAVSPAEPAEQGEDSAP